MKTQLKHKIIETSRTAILISVLLISFTLTNIPNINAGNVSGIMTTLASSPMNLTCFTVDPTTGYFYGQGDQGSTNYYRYDPTTNTWSSLTPCPQSSGNNGGATYLNGKIYNSYCSNGIIAIYTIATDSWTTITGGINSGNICNDGTDVYISGNNIFKKYVVNNGTWVDLTGTTCEPWGGIQYKNGFFYLHEGNGSLGFKRYQVSSNTWTTLPNVPYGSVLGSAIYDAYYYCQGDYGGTNLYSYDLGAGEWNNILTLPFATNDAAIVTYGNSLFIVQGEAGTGFAKFTPTNPMLTNMEGTALVYTLGDSALKITNTLIVSQNTGVNLISASVSITSHYEAGKDLLSYSPVNGITGSWNPTTGVLSLTGTASIADYQTALRSVRFSNLDPNSGNSPRNISFKVYDGVKYSNTATRIITIPGPPTVSTKPITDITTFSAISGGVVTDDGTSPILSRGICWNTSGMPVITDNHTSNGTGLGVFTSTLNNLVNQTTYHVRAYATNSHGTSYGEELVFVAQTVTCIPVVSSEPCLYMWISNVSTAGGITNFNNSSSCSSTSYTNYSSTISASQTPGNTITMSFTSDTYPMNYAVWIDYNDDATFSSDEKVISLGNSTMTTSTVFTIPANAPIGTHRMRVRGDYNGNSTPNDPCIALMYGESEDYSFSVVNSTPADPSVTAESFLICEGSNTQLTAEGGDGEIHWFTNSCGGTFFEAGSPITVYPTTTTTYYAKNFFNGTYSSNCVSVTVTVTPATEGGNVTGTDYITYGSSTGILRLENHVGTILRWEKKLNYGSWVMIPNTDSIYSETPTASGIWSYRALVQSGMCDTEYSALYAVNVKKAPLTVKANNKSKAYGDAEPTLDYTASGTLFNGDTYNVITGVTLSTVTGSDASYGFHTIHAMGGTANNYIINHVNGILDVSQASIVVSANENQHKTFGSTNPTYTYSVNPAMHYSDSFTGSLTRVTGENAGTYAINQGTLSAGSNYNIIFVPENFIIYPKVIAIIPSVGQTKVYDQTDPTFTYTHTPSLLGNDAIIGELGRVAGENVGSYDFTLGTLSATSNYLLLLSTTSTFDITGKEIIVTVNPGQSKIYGETDPDFLYTYSPILHGEVFITGKLGRETGENVGNYIINKGTLSPSNPNYIIRLITNPFSISKAPLTVVANSYTRCKNDPNQTFNYTYFGFVKNETAAILDVEPTISCEATVNSTSGIYPINLSGGMDNNYTFDYVNGTLTIDDCNNIEANKPGIVTIYPNPAKDIITIENAENSTLTIYSIIGEIISSFNITEQKATIDLSVYSSGNYLFKIIKGSNVVTKKITVR